MMRRPYWKRAHHDFRFWVGLILMLTAITIYVLSDDLAFLPHHQGSKDYEPKLLYRCDSNLSISVVGWTHLADLFADTARRRPIGEAWVLSER